MNRTISFKTAVAAASVSAFTAFVPVFAQEEAEAGKPADEIAAPAAAKPEKAFYPLMRCVRVEGKVQVLKPRTTGDRKTARSTFQMERADATKGLPSAPFGISEADTRRFQIGERTAM